MTVFMIFNNYIITISGNRPIAGYRYPEIDQSLGNHTQILISYVLSGVFFVLPFGRLPGILPGNQSISEQSPILSSWLTSGYGYPEVKFSEKIQKFYF